jgi:hypothetical protein
MAGYGTGLHIHHLPGLCQDAVGHGFCPCRYIVTDGVGRMGMKKGMEILDEFMRVRAVRSAQFALACQVGLEAHLLAYLSPSFETLCQKTVMACKCQRTVCNHISIVLLPGVHSGPVCWV